VNWRGVEQFATKSEPTAGTRLEKKHLSMVESVDWEIGDETFGA
jgi:hypothetical protein